MFVMDISTTLINFSSYSLNEVAAVCNLQLAIDENIETIASQPESHQCYRTAFEKLKKSIQDQISLQSKKKEYLNHSQEALEIKFDEWMSGLLKSFSGPDTTEQALNYEIDGLGSDKNALVNLRAKKQPAEAVPTQNPQLPTSEETLDLEIDLLEKRIDYYMKFKDFFIFYKKKKSEFEVQDSRFEQLIQELKMSSQLIDQALACINPAPSNALASLREYRSQRGAKTGLMQNSIATSATTSEETLSQTMKRRQVTIAPRPSLQSFFTPKAEYFSNLQALLNEPNPYADDPIPDPDEPIIPVRHGLNFNLQGLNLSRLQDTLNEFAETTPSSESDETDNLSVHTDQQPPLEVNPTIETSQSSSSVLDDIGGAPLHTDQQPSTEVGNDSHRLQGSTTTEEHPQEENGELKDINAIPSSTSTDKEKNPLKPVSNISPTPLPITFPPATRRVKPLFIAISAIAFSGVCYMIFTRYRLEILSSLDKWKWLRKA
jgi:hypothetical protein